MKQSPLTVPIRPITTRRRLTIDFIAMTVYLTGVYAWSLTIYPLGLDYGVIDGLFLSHPWLGGILGDSIVPFHLFNLFLLYLCMTCIYFFVKMAVRGPWWLGTLAATLFMANPVHSEAVLYLCGFVFLIPALAALITLMTYAAARHFERTWLLVLAYGLLALTLTIPTLGMTTALGIALFFYEWLAVEKQKRNIWLALVPVAFSVAALVVMNDRYASVLSLSQLVHWRSFYLIMYPIGFLPETMETFEAYPWLGWVAAAVVVLMTVAICRKARSRAMVFGLLAMVSVGLVPRAVKVDPVHLTAGGKLLLPNVFFNVAFVALCLRIMDHPKWRKPVVLLTTVLCLIFFGLQLQAISAWRHAGNLVKTFHQELAKIPPEEEVGILPDYRHCQSAIIDLPFTVNDESPYAPAREVTRLLRMNYDVPSRMQVWLEDWSPEGGTLRVEGKTPEEAITEYDGLFGGGKDEAHGGGYVIKLIRDDKGFRLKFTANTRKLPGTILPAKRKADATPAP